MAGRRIPKHERGRSRPPSLMLRARQWSICRRRFRPFAEHVHAPALAVEHYKAVHQCKQRVVLGPLDVQARVELRAALPDDNAPRGDVFARVGFDASALGIRIATVPRRALTFFMCHVDLSLLIARMSEQLL